MYSQNGAQGSEFGRTRIQKCRTEKLIKIHQKVCTICTYIPGPLELVVARGWSPLPPIFSQVSIEAKPSLSHDFEFIYRALPPSPWFSDLPKALLQAKRLGLSEFFPLVDARLGCHAWLAGKRLPVLAPAPVDSTVNVGVFFLRITKILSLWLGSLSHLFY